MMVYLAILAIVAILAFATGFAKQSFISDRVAVLNDDLRKQLLTDVTEQVSRFCQPTILSDGTPVADEQFDPKAWQTITDINSRLSVVQHSQARVEQACRAIAQDQIIEMSALLVGVKSSVEAVVTNQENVIDLVSVPCESGGNCDRVGIGTHLSDVPTKLQNAAQELSGLGHGPLSQLQRQVDQLDEVMGKGDQLIEKGDQVINASWSQLSQVQTRLLEILSEQESLKLEVKADNPAIVIEFDRPLATDCSTINMVIMPERRSDNASGDFRSAIFSDNVRKVGENTCQVKLQKLLSDEELMALFDLKNGATLEILAFRKANNSTENTVIE
ncbi:hypothetical protein RKLH11_1335 [Rhodobacteraceae bacterium KLH11]|nr:hypothetical protein RKLH11_1335 [Rhodobacteraceae bacterium KLH11]